MENLKELIERASEAMTMGSAACNNHAVPEAKESFCSLLCVTPCVNVRQNGCPSLN